MNGKVKIFKKAAVSILATALTAVSISALTLSASAEEDLVFRGITFTPWTSTNQLPQTTGNYYLTSDVQISKPNNIMSKQEIKLCLNGHSVTMTRSAMIYNLMGGASLSLYDNGSAEHHYKTKSNAAAEIGTGDGVFYGGYLTSTNSNGFIQMMEGTTFNMYGGNIVGFSSTGVSANGGTFNMYGGSILGCYTNTKNGAGVYVASGGAFNMMGGQIRDNKVDDYEKGGGVVLFDGKFTVSGDAVITGNKTMGDVTENVYVSEGRTISIGEGGLSDNASIGLTAGSAASSVALVSGANGNESAFFSDNTGKSFAVDPEGQLLLGDFATATYAQVGDDYDAEFSGDNQASLWKVTVTPGTDTVTSLSVKVNEKTPDAPLSIGTSFSGGGSIVFGVVLNGIAADVQSFKALVNGNAVTTTVE